MKILIVDDSKPIRSLLRYLLSQMQIETEQAEDGLAALDILRTRTDFDVALVDWDMPRMNGLDLVKAVRTSAVHNEMKIMMVTTQNTMDRVAAAIEAGATDFLMKPVTRESLEDKLRVLGVVA